MRLPAVNYRLSFEFFCAHSRAFIRFVALLTGLVLWCVGITGAQGAAVYGVGNDSCSSWIDTRESGDGWQPLEQWLLGYLSGASDNINTTATETDAAAVVSAVDNYCQINPQHSLLQAARGMSKPAGISVAGLGSTEGEIGNQTEMNRICRDTYPNLNFGSFPVRWATTSDYREFSTYKGWNNEMPLIEDQVALRAENTIFTNEDRSYDQATGAISPKGSYPGAVVITDNNARFSGRSKTAKPVCVWGPPNSALR